MKRLVILLSSVLLLCSCNNINDKRYEYVNLYKDMYKSDVFVENVYFDKYINSNVYVLYYYQTNNQWCNKRYIVVDDSGHTYDLTR